MEGSGLVIVTAVGEKSEWGMTMSMVMGEAEYTPLQEKLEVVATQIGKLGGGVAVVLRRGPGGGGLLLLRKKVGLLERSGAAW